MRKLSSNENVILSDPNYPNGRIRNNTGTGNGTPVNENVYGDIHVNKDKLMDLYGIEPNGLPDNEANGYQIIEAYRALASKNDFILPLSLVSGVLSVPIKLGFMLDNEQVVCKAGFDLDSETEIKGSDAPTFTLTINGSFKANEYVRLIKTASGVTLVRLADSVSLDAMVLALAYLKKASQAEENAGAIDTKATTPLTNLVAFMRRVNGVDSATFLATALVNGLYPKEHFSIVAGLVNKTLNIGSFSGVDIDSGSLGTTYTVAGNVVSATLTAKVNNSSTIRVVLANTMTDTNYYVRIFIQSLSADIDDDNNIGSAVYKVINATTIDVNVTEFASQTQNLKFVIEAVKF